MAESVVVAMKCRNWHGAKGRQIQPTTGGDTMSIHRDATKWRRKLKAVQEVSRRDREVIINNVMHIIDIELLKEVYRQLKGNKAAGVDGVTKITYEKNLEENLRELLEIIHSMRYQAKPSRLVEIPKEDGSTRTLAIGCLEDKIVQGAVYLILQSVYEPVFKHCSYGFRPGRNCHDALRVLNQHSYRIYDGMVIDMDIAKCFDSISHQKMLEVLDKKISDKKFKRLIIRIMKSPVLKEGKSHLTEIGCPQGNILSPLLANIFLHEVLDEWFESTKANHLKHPAHMVRYCDDVIMIFSSPEEGRRVYRTLPKRLEKYGLRMHETKSKSLSSGETAAERAALEGKRLETYKFLGFTCYFGRGKNGRYRLMYTSRRDRFTAKIKAIRQLLKQNLNTKNSEALLKHIVKIVRGWINYHGISDNGRRVNSFRERVRNLIYWWFNRRGKKRAMTWERLKHVLERINYPTTYTTVSMFTRPLSM